MLPSLSSLGWCGETQSMKQSKSWKMTPGQSWTLFPVPVDTGLFYSMTSSVVGCATAPDQSPESDDVFDTTKH